MKICFVINRLITGGAQNTLKSVADGIANNKNNKINIVAFEKKIKKNVEFKKGIRVKYLNKENHYNNIINFFKFFVFMLNNHKEFNYVISTGDAQTIIITRIVCFLFKKKQIPWIQFHYKTSEPRNFFKKFIWRKLFSNGNFFDYSVVACSKYIKKAYEKDLLWKRVSVIYQCIDPKFINKSINYSFKDKINKIYKNKKVILAPGRIDKDKNHLSIIKAINNLSKIRKDFVLLIHGEKGNNYRNILNYISENKLEKFVVIINLIKLNEFINWMKFSNLVVLNSIQEPIGTIAYENMFLKSNFMISYQTGWKEMIPNKNYENVIINPHDEIEIFLKIKKLLKKRLNKRISLKYFNFISNFTNINISNEWLKFINRQ